MSTARPRRPLPEIVVLDGDNMHLANLCGPLDENLRQLADGLGVKLSRRGSRVTLDGENAELAARALRRFHHQATHKALDIEDIQLGLVEIKADIQAAQARAELEASAAAEAQTNAAARGARSKKGANDARSADVSMAGGIGGSNARSSAAAAPATDAARTRPLVAQDALPDLPPIDDASDTIALRTRRSDLRPRTPRQRDYLNNILKHDITFGVGPAGTGKTWLAVACAIDAMERETVQRIVLTRPAVEAGERLGFLPGDLAQKVDPYLRPLYDALYDLMGFERVQRMFEKQSIEIAPLAYMRGRTLNHAFVILDEAQNTTPEQMKMFLTRIGFGSKAVITGDPSQVDLPRGQQSGLAHAVEVLAEVQGIASTRFSSRDVVRHPLVARIVDAYDAAG
ncbi:MAG: PhoH family protein [Burkholderiaceae bacterium]